MRYDERCDHERADTQDPRPGRERRAKFSDGIKGIGLVGPGDAERRPATEYPLSPSQHAIDVPQRQRAKHPRNAGKANRGARPRPPVPPRGNHRGHRQAVKDVQRAGISREQPPDGCGSSCYNLRVESALRRLDDGPSRTRAMHRLPGPGAGCHHRWVAVRGYGRAAAGCFTRVPAVSMMSSTIKVLRPFTSPSGSSLR